MHGLSEGYGVKTNLGIHRILRSVLTRRQLLRLVERGMGFSIASRHPARLQLIAMLILCVVQLRYWIGTDHSTVWTAGQRPFALVKWLFFEPAFFDRVVRNNLRSDIAARSPYRLSWSLNLHLHFCIRACFLHLEIESSLRS